MVPRGWWHPQGRTILTRDVDGNCASYLLWLRGVAHCGMSTAKVLLKMEGRGVLQDLIPDVWQLDLAYVPVKGWIIDPDVHGLCHGSGNTVHLSTHHEEIVHTDAMT